MATNNSNVTMYPQQQQAHTTFQLPPPQQQAYYQPHAQQQQYIFDGTAATAASVGVDTTRADEDYTEAPIVPAYDKSKADTDEAIAIILLVLSLFMGWFILWIVIFVLYRKSPSEKARLCAKISLILTIVSFIPLLLFFFFFIVYLVLVALGFSQFKKSW